MWYAVTKELTKIKININQTKGQNDSQDRESKSKNPKNQQSKPIIELSETLSSNFLTNIDTFVSEQIKLFKKIQRKIEVVFNHKNKEVIPRLIFTAQGKAKANNEVDAITGATGTSKALEKLLNESIEKNLSLLKS